MERRKPKRDRRTLRRTQTLHCKRRRRVIWETYIPVDVGESERCPGGGQVNRAYLPRNYRYYCQRTVCGICCLYSAKEPVYARNCLRETMGQVETSDRVQV